MWPGKVYGLPPDQMGGLDEDRMVSGVTRVLHCPDTHFSSTASRISGGAGGEERGKSIEAWQPLFLPPRPDLVAPEAQLTVVQQVADHFLAARADRVVQERATPIVTVHEITPGSMQLLELRVGGRAGMGLLWATLFPVTEMPNSQA